jgi:hypothetical protein
MAAMVIFLPARHSSLKVRGPVARGEFSSPSEMPGSSSPSASSMPSPSPWQPPSPRLGTLMSATLAAANRNRRRWVGSAIHLGVCTTRAYTVCHGRIF